MTDTTEAAETNELICMQCDKTLRENDDKEITEKGPLCRDCYNRLAEQVQNMVQQQGENINYSAATIGAVVGAAVGVIVWWGFTVLTNIEFGLVAVVIGFTVAKGIALTTGGKRSRELQIMSVIVASLAYFYANYLVTRTFILREYPQYADKLGFLPEPRLLFALTKMSFDLFTIVFLAIIVYEAWRLVAPFQLQKN